jgi:serine/threonine protein kinase
MNIGDTIILQDFSNEKFIITKIIEGGFGIVYFLQPLSNYLDNVVMKVFKSNDYRDNYREALLWSKLGYHKNIAEYLCFGKYNDNFYILSHRYDRTLNDLKSNELSDNTIRNILIGLINGLNFSFKKINLIHRDIKPSNIFIDKEEIKIGDFGLSSYLNKKVILSKDFTNVETINIMSNMAYGGTIPFMAPELLLNNNVSDFNISSDIFAVGVTIFTIVTNGLFPYNFKTGLFNGKSWEIFNEKIKDEILKDVITKCIKLDYNERYKNYIEISVDLNINLESYNNKDTLSNIISYIQTLRRTNQSDRAKILINDTLVDFPEHPLLINQLAILFLKDNDEKEYICLLKSLFEKNNKYDIELYYDPLFNLAGYYFHNGNLNQIKILLDRFEIKNKKYLYEIYPCYIIYLYLIGNGNEAYDMLSKYIINHRVHSNYFFFYFIIAFRLGCIDGAIKLLQKIKIEETENIIKYYKKYNGKALFDAINILSNELFGGEL